MKAIYLSGWQVAGDANLGETMYPDQSLYPGELRAGRRAPDQQGAAPRRPDRVGEGKRERDWFAPIVADAEAGFGGMLNAFELMKRDDRGGRRGRALRGPARVREEVRSPRRQGAVPTAQFIGTLTAARLAADICGVPAMVIARTDAGQRHVADE